MKTQIATMIAVFAVAVCSSIASQNSLVTIYQPHWLSDEADPVLCPVPLVTGGAYPEVFFEAITMPHPPLTRNAHVDGEGDVNAASAVGIVLRCVPHPRVKEQVRKIAEFERELATKKEEKTSEAATQLENAKKVLVEMRSKYRDEHPLVKEQLRKIAESERGLAPNK